MDMLIGAAIFLCGYLTCFWTVKKSVRISKSSDRETVTVKRTRPHFGNPMRPYRAEESPYERNKKGLYEPVKPKTE